jgi:hypothetical protein
VQHETTLRDLLSHRVGFAQYNALFMQDKARLYLDKSETLNTADVFPLPLGSARSTSTIIGIMPWPPSLHSPWSASHLANTSSSTSSSPSERRAPP